MGYTTYFEGEFKLSRPMQPEHMAYLKAFADSRRVIRDRTITATIPDPIREAVGLPVGEEGEYHVADLDDGSIANDNDLLAATGVVDSDAPPGTQPGLWCDWVPADDGAAIVWNGGEKFYNYVEWLEWLIRHLLAPWGYVLNGTVGWFGEDPDDQGKIVVNDNKLRIERD